MKLRILLASAALLVLTQAPFALAQTKAVKIGVLNDQGGPYSSVTGPGAVAAARMAIEDVGGPVLGKPVELVAADHQHKPDVGSAIARRWYDAEGVDAVFDIYNSGVALAVQRLAQEKNKVLISSVNTAEVTGKSCATNGLQWGGDGYALANLTVKGAYKGKPESWYFLTVDYAAGHSLEKDARAAVEAQGGKVLGAVRFPLGSTDFSSYLLQAQASKADNIGILGGGTDLLNAIKQADEFQIRKTKQKVIPFALTTADVVALTNQTAQGFPLVMSFYWDENAATRAWTERFRKSQGKLPTDLQANVYSAVLHYLNAVQAAGTTDAKAVLAKMRDTPVEDFYTHGARIREDGRLMRDMIYAEAKAPGQMKSKDDLVSVVKRFTGEQAFLPRALSECPLVKK
ncbi:ABC transporter substrate-binding protein [Ottowia oryzae]|uniref:ABC transporter permease n=1 Tax=Ottowia oryzae TaxID=2109914 RepID=A0A2S0MBE8_9BURK|nr:ABC transporter substrate-binding protein [Ottowia oryzae]AVO33121.1 ABC transporter permease [Ottowia oryzae]